MKQRGFTLLEILISVALILSVIHSAFVLLSTTFSVNKEMIAEKELVEVGEFLQNRISEEFRRCSKVEAPLGKDGTIYTQINEDPISIQCVKLLRSHYTSYASAYKEELIYLRGYEEDGRSSVWLFKNARESLSVDIKHYSSYGGYEIGTYVEEMTIAQVDTAIYQIELKLRYLDTDIRKTKHFLVTLQD